FGSGCVVEPGIFDCTARQYSGVVGTAQDDADAASLAQRKQGLDRFLLEERVASSQQKAVEITRLRELPASLPLVEAASDRFDQPLLAQRDQGLVCPRH